MFSSLYYFNGPTSLGSLRDIRLIRGNKIIKNLFYDYLLTGKKLKDEKLQLDDVIFIPKRLKSVTITGEINKPGIFELKETETLKDLIDYSGGLKSIAYIDRIQIDRVVPFDARDTVGMERMYIDVNYKDLLENQTNFKLHDQDKVHVFSILDSRQNVVEITGAVTGPGLYRLRSIKSF